MTNEGGHLTGTMYYTMVQITRHIKLIGKKNLEKDLTGLTFEEYSILDFIYCTPGLCQSDLASFLVIEKGRICKLVESLEMKGFIKRKAGIRNKKLIKILKITESGKKILAKNQVLALNLMHLLHSKFPENEITALDKNLKILLKSIIEFSENN